MKNSGYEACRARKWKRKLRTTPNHLTVADIRKAFSVRTITPEDRNKIVMRYMGDSPVPPAWTYAGVRGTFGNKIARVWARKLRHRPSGIYRDHSGRWVHFVTQSIHDFEKSMPKGGNPVTVDSSKFIVDEFHSMF